MTIIPHMARPSGVGTVHDIYTERASLYSLTLEPEPKQLYLVSDEDRGRMRERVLFAPAPDARLVEPHPREVNRALRGAILAALRSAGYKVRERFPLVVDTATNYAPRLTPLEIYPAFTLDVIDVGGRHYLCLNHRLVVRAKLSLATLMRRDTTFRPDPGQRMLFRHEEGWAEGTLLVAGAADSRLALPAGGAVQITNGDIVPALTRGQIARLAPALDISAQQLERTVKTLSFLTVANAPRARLDACTEFAGRLAAAFPIIDGGTTVRLDPTPAVLRPPAFVLGKDLVEAEVAFDHLDRSKRARDILTGLTSFGAYEQPAAPLRLVVLTTADRAEPMDRLIARLSRGANRYPGALRTFGSDIVVRERLTARTIDEYEDRLQEFVRGPARRETDVALVYLPKVGNTDDHRHPYFRVKGFLVREGLASQMVDEATVLDPEWRDLNLALNIYAKAGYAPWVLDEQGLGPLPNLRIKNETG